VVTPRGDSVLKGINNKEIVLSYYWQQVVPGTILRNFNFSFLGSKLSLSIELSLFELKLIFDHPVNWKSITIHFGLTFTGLSSYNSSTFFVYYNVLMPIFLITTEQQVY
jgi:hypothetical protein